MAQSILVFFAVLNLLLGAVFADNIFEPLPRFGVTLVPKRQIVDEVYMDISIDGKQVGRINIGLWTKHVPKTVKNFIALCEGTAGIGNHGKPLHYKGTVFHRIVHGFVAQAGDVVNRDGTSGESIYGDVFDDENV